MQITVIHRRFKDAEMVSKRETCRKGKVGRTAAASARVGQRKTKLARKIIRSLMN